MEHTLRSVEQTDGSMEQTERSVEYALRSVEQTEGNMEQTNRSVEHALRPNALVYNESILNETVGYIVAFLKENLKNKYQRNLG